MPRSRRRHHSHSRSRSRSHSYDRDREPKRRRIDAYESPNHRRSLSSDEDSSIAQETEANTSIKNESKKNDAAKEGNENGNIENDDVIEITDEDDDEGGEVDDCSKENNHKGGMDKSTAEMSEVETDNLDNKIDTHSLNKSNVKEAETSETEATEEVSIVEEDKLKELEESINEEVNDTIEIESEDDDEKLEPSDSKISTSNTDMVQLTAKVKENILKEHKGKPMSPKNLQKKIEIELRKEQKRIEREEKEKRRQELKEEKIKQKQEKEEQRKREIEAKQKEKELKEEKKKKEREEKERKRKEKEEMEEQKRKEREQEKLKKQQEIEEKNKEKQKIEEQKQKTAAAFVSFFKKKEKSEDKKPEENSFMFMPFEVKSDMRLASHVRKKINAEEKDNLIKHLEEQNATKLYLQELKDGKPIGNSPKTWPGEDSEVNDDDDVMIIEDTPLGESLVQDGPKTAKMKAKFFKFDENRRPPYYGTWRKKSKHINPRRPFSQDKEFFDYEVDSDDDWEDEGDVGEVESLKGSDEEEKEASDEEYEVDNEFFVPHGHLSDDEMNDDEEKPLSPETHKAQLKLLKNEFEEERKSKTMKIKPRIIGCIWQNKAKDVVEEAIQKFLEPLSVICLGPIKIQKRDSIINQTPVRKRDSLPSKKKLEKEYVPAFLALIHGSVKKRKHLVKQFLDYLKESDIPANVSLISLNRDFRELAQWIKCPDKGPMYNKHCWYVPETIRKEYEIDLPLPNSWESKNWPKVKKT